MSSTSLARLDTPFDQELLGKGGRKPAEEDFTLEGKPSLDRVTRWAGFVILLVLIAIVVGATSIPLESAVVAPGRVIVEGNTKTIQSQDGGKIKKILVKEGDSVAAGQVLIEFDRLREQASYDAYDARYTRAIARSARLIAEAAGYNQIEWPPELQERATDKTISEIMQIEEDLFQARREEYAGQREIAERRVAQYKQRVDALMEQIDATEAQRRLIAEEEQDTQILVDKGLARKPLLLALQRRRAELGGEKSRLIGELGQAREALSGAESEFLNLDHQHVIEVMDELTLSDATVAETLERRRSAADLLDQGSLLAPESGKIANLLFFGEGGVISPAVPIMDIVPQNDAFVVVANVRPDDIDSVYEGQDAEVRLTAYSMRTVQPMLAMTQTVAADLFVNPTSGDAYYKVRVVIDPVSRAEQPDVEFYPGMPADVIIKTGHRTLAEYLIDPIRRYVYLSFREE
jgi:HlyD family type I secretion membrane fusion protein